MLLLMCKVVRLFMMNKKGFTLVEILVSIGLLALLDTNNFFNFLLYPRK